MGSAKTIGKTILVLGAIGAVIAASFLLTNHFQRVVPIVPGVQGCWRLDGSARQIECLSDHFHEGANEAAGDASGKARDEQIIEYVSRTERLAAEDQRLGGVCHPAMHELGRSSGRFAVSEGRVPTFPPAAESLCTAGYVHGLAEGYLDKTPNVDVAMIFPKLCHEQDAIAGCAHGIGHALVRAFPTGDQIDKTTEVIDSCRELPKNSINDCYDGLYMELAMRTQPSPIAVDDYVSICNEAEQNEDVGLGLSCWGYLGLSTASNDVAIEQVARLCMDAPLPSQYPCIEGYGRDLGVNRVASCEFDGSTKGLRTRCIEGAIGLQVGSGHISSRDAIAACRTMEAKSATEQCLSAVRRYAGSAKNSA